MLRTFGVADLELLAGSSLDAEVLADIPQAAWHAAEGALASVHVTATKPPAGTAVPLR